MERILSAIHQANRDYGIWPTLRQAALELVFYLFVLWFGFMVIIDGH